LAIDQFGTRVRLESTTSLSNGGLGTHHWIFRLGVWQIHHYHSSV